jgi:hypothetical protein
MEVVWVFRYTGEMNKRVEERESSREENTT